MFKFLTTALIATVLTGCGSDELTEFRLRQLNIACLNGKIAGEYLVELETGKLEKVYASNLRDLKFKLKTLPESVKNIDYNFKLLNSNTTPSTQTPVTRDQANLGPNIIKANFLWRRGYYGQGVKLGLIDSGFDVNGLYLKHAILENTEELGRDEDRNGYVNDRYGWNTLDDKPLTGDDGNHGTLVGSVIVASHRDGLKIGVAPEAKLIPVTALKPGADEMTDVSGDSNSIIKALDYSVLRGAEVINASWGGDNCSTHIQRKIQEITDAGVIFITSSGNEGVDIDENIKFPASLPIINVITVGALDDFGQLFHESNFGSLVDFFAPGFGVVSLLPGNRLALVNGSSIATPYVTGSLALLKSAFNEAEYSDIIKALRQTSTGKTNKTPNLEEAFLQLKASFNLTPP